MALAAPKLDDRGFQDIVDEARKRIPHYCHEWTDHNLSDPGVTLIELFAWMTDVMLYRLNQVPDLHYVKFLEMLGITLREPAPARVPVTFWLSAPQPNPVIIPAGTEVASTQTEAQASIVFSTDAEFCVCPPRLKSVTSRVTAGEQGKRAYRDHDLRALEAGFEGVSVFSRVPQVDDALYFGFENDLSQHILRLELEYDRAAGTGIVPEKPPYVWEASTGRQETRWEACFVESDTTRGMNDAGAVQLHLSAMGKWDVNRKRLYWVRARNRYAADEHPGDIAPYETSPRLRRVSVASVGGTVPATHAQQVVREFLGQSDGSPGQRFQLQFTPLLGRQPGECLSVQVEGEPAQNWTEVPDLADAGPDDRHYTLDGVTGELRLGPAVRQPDGTVKLYGAVPPRGANLVFSRYRFGGGQVGNVQAGVLNTLKTAIPYIAQVSNSEPAWGGLDAETLEAAKARAPAMLRARERAVTEGDFEFLARQALPGVIGRVKCLQPRPSDAGRVVPGQVYLLVIPRVPQPNGYLELERLRLEDEHVAALAAYLEERRLLTTRVDVRPPAYHCVAARVKLQVASWADRDSVEAEVLSRLYHFLNPLSGGPDGTGWPFGRDLFLSDIYPCLQGIPQVRFVRGVEMYQAGTDGEAQGEALEFLEVRAHGVIASGRHAVEFV